MAIVLAVALLAPSPRAQEPVFRAESPLVVAHTTVTDAKGKYVLTLDEEDFALYVEGQPVEFLLDYSFVPISLVLVVQNCADCTAAIKKLRKVGVLFHPLVTGDRGEIAVVSYSHMPVVRQNFTRGADAVERTLASLKPAGKGGALYDALAQAVTLLAPRLRGKRGVILHIGERIDRGSERKLEEVAGLLEQNNILLYSLTYSTLKTAFTDKEAWKDNTRDSEFYEKPADGIMRTPPPEAPYGMPRAPVHMQTPDQVQMGSRTAPVPEPNSGPNPNGDTNLLAVFTLLRDATKKNIARELAQLTGGRELDFARQDALEKAIARIGEELHSQYLLSFRPLREQFDTYQRIEVRVDREGRHTVRTRPGFWLPSPAQ